MERREVRLQRPTLNLKNDQGSLKLPLREEDMGLVILSSQEKVNITIS